MSVKITKNKTLLTIIVIGVILVTAMIAILIVLGVQRKNARSEVDVTADDLTAEQVVSGVIKKMNYSNLTLIENIKGYYDNFPMDAVSDHALYVSGKSGPEVELTCFVLKDGYSCSDIEASITEHTNEKISQVSVQGCSAKVKGKYPYVFVAIAQDSESAVSAFETVLNDKKRELEQN